MKKIIAVLLMLSMMLSLAACGGSTEAQPETPAPEAEAPAPQATIEIAEDAENEEIAVAALKAFLAEDIYGKLVGDFEQFTGQQARPLEITSASEYIIPDFNGQEMHLLMVYGTADIWYDNGAFDSMILLVDLNTGAVYDQYSMDIFNFTGDTSDYEGKVRFCLNVYDSYLMGNNEGFMTSPRTEVKTDLTTEEIAAINQAIR